MSKILRINMSDRSITSQEVPERYKNLAGRGLTTSMICDEIDPTCHALGPNNKIFMAPGIVTGTSAPSSGRISVGAKSPLTGGIKESNAGTSWAQIVAKLQIKVIAIEGKATEGWWGIVINKEGVELVPADEYTGAGLYDIFPKLYAKYGDKVSIAAIGKAGEEKMTMAGVCFCDIDKRPSRYAARGGLGAVMGSKGVKFIVVDGAGAAGVELADKDVFNTGKKKLAAALLEHAVTKPGGALNTYGTAVLVNILNEAKGLPTRNFSSGEFAGAAKISGEAMSELCKERGGVGVMGHACHPGCIIKCSNVIPDKDGNELASCIEYETTWAFGANCGIDDLDVIGKLTTMCNDLGIDTIEAGVTIGVAMEAGLADFGDGDKAVALLGEVAEATPLGRILGNGAGSTAKAYGVVRCPTVKNQGMPAYEPRRIKGIGMTYAIGTQGADHTSGYTIAPEILKVGGDPDPGDPDKVELVRAFHYTTAFIDASGHCLFIAFAILDIPSGFEGFVEECNGVFGTNWTGDDVAKIGKEIIDKEVAFNEAAGLGAADNRLPEFMTYEKLPPLDCEWDVTDEQLDSVFG